MNKDGVERNWRTYFVDMKYRPERPPRFPPDAGRELIVKFLTGGDDLRGGRDNVGVRLVLRSGRALDYPNVNGGRRWLDNTENSASLPLPAGVTVADIRAVRLFTNFRGGTGGDNWNLPRLTIDARDGAGRRALFDRDGMPLVRFTGDHPAHEFPIE